MDEQPPIAANAIEIRIEEIAQLFHSLDPFPFRERDLAKEAEEFIVGCTRRRNADPAPPHKVQKKDLETQLCFSRVAGKHLREGGAKLNHSARRTRRASANLFDSSLRLSSRLGIVHGAG
jgi:hypothetical protein